MSFPNKDDFLRMNFLYQASQIVVQPKSDHKPNTTLDRHNLNLSRFYIQQMKKVAQKKVLRISPEVKQTFCKGCNTLLIPGMSSTQRVRSKRQQHVVIRCLVCGLTKRFNCNNTQKKNHKKKKEKNNNNNNNNQTNNDNNNISQIKNCQNVSKQPTTKIKKKEN
ncbi:ribonuclease p protein subunit p21 [Anaeramoeba flamelloides]|uniref:Ribonuclease p protein subunit p21 n=1 Tax=Anaeramoeba flamelloides TaxID=1746091 RepID=A0AAV7ZR52_9EUKA|nr:ribonuclease p protein subunit p21 [Anaeramoeba flamelloides]KAJ6232968.1 ribonuclease p protein subunit p21 [Anaeramoeba flamelloides]